MEEQRYTEEEKREVGRKENGARQGSRRGMNVEKDTQTDR